MMKPAKFIGHTESEQRHAGCVFPLIACGPNHIATGFDRI
jgi:hypothetical protein